MQALITYRYVLNLDAECLVDCWVTSLANTSRVGINSCTDNFGVSFFNRLLSFFYVHSNNFLSFFTITFFWELLSIQQVLNHITL